ncbi:MAG: response regulator [Fuerstiella sp.]|jgi:CheY-like chemotaxis protein|nr:response regulator [Fuerstiella sp.]
MIQNIARQILLVEDSPSDAHLAMRAFSQSTFASTVNHAKDGAEALAMLRQEGDFHECPRPDLIFLDLNMPRVNGRQVLDQLQMDPDLGLIPIVVLSTSTDEKDVLNAYRLGTSSYVVKPVDLNEFYRVIEAVQNYWFKLCALPVSQN